MHRAGYYSCQTSPLRGSESHHSSRYILPGARSAHPSSVRFLQPAGRSIPRAHSSETLALGERVQVEQLSEWSKQRFAAPMPRTAIIADSTSHQSQSQVDRQILARKSKNATRPAPNTTESQVKHIQDLSYRRLLKKQTENTSKERSHYARRYEEEMDRTVAEQESRLKALRQEAQDLREEASHHRSLIIQFEDSLKGTKRAFLASDWQDKSKSRSFRTEDLARVMYKKSQQQAVLFTKEQECRDQVRTSNERIAQLREAAERLDVQISAIEKELEQVRKSQLLHFGRLLAEGADSRAQGLAWLVRKLWSAGSTVSVDMFPEFLDEEAVHCVLFLAQKTLEAEELSTYLQACKAHAPSEVPIVRNHWNNIQARLKATARSLKIRMPQVDPRRLSLSQIPRNEPAAIPLTVTNESDLSAVESRLAELRDLIQKVQDAEIRRLTSECFLNNYEKKHRVNLKTLLAAIVGVDVIDRYLATINKEQKTLAEQMAKAKTFCFQGV